MRDLIEKSYSRITYIPLTQGKFACVHKGIHTEISKAKWCAMYDGYNWYAVRTDENDTTVRMHRVIWEFAHGPIPEGMQIDHKDRDTLNNDHTTNLRLANAQQNAANRVKQKGCLSKYKGVTIEKKVGKWKVHIKVNDKTIYLGCYDNEEQAAWAYDAAANKYFGKFAHLNFTKQSDEFYKDILDNLPIRKPTSQFIGVTWDKVHEKWMSQIAHNKKHYNLGRFDSEIEAAKAFDKKAIDLRGPTTKTNFPIESYRLTT